MNNYRKWKWTLSFGILLCCLENTTVLGILETGKVPTADD